MQLLRKRIPVTRLDLGDLIVGQFGEFFFPATSRQNARVLAQERNNRSTVPSGMSTISITLRLKVS